MNRIGWGFCVTIAWATAGCATSFVETTPLNGAPRALGPRAPDSVEVFASTPPTRPHVDVALLRANQPNWGEVDTPMMMRSLLEQAGKMGCDAIFVSGAAQRQGAIDDLRLLDPGSRALLATCIAYLPNSEPANPPPRAVNAFLLLPAEHEEPKPKPAVVADRVSVGTRRR